MAEVINFREKQLEFIEAAIEGFAEIKRIRELLEEQKEEPTSRSTKPAPAETPKVTVKKEEKAPEVRKVEESNVKEVKEESPAPRRKTSARARKTVA